MERLPENDILLSAHTTIGLGGPARFFHECADPAQLPELLEFARSRDLSVFLLGGGSNVIFADEGFTGLVIKIAWRGISMDRDGEDVIVRAQAGEVWDALVERALDESLGGLECLSGIPGTAGAAPVQNIGAYGRELGDCLESVRVLERASGRVSELGAGECGFGYRRSRFKYEDRDRWVITEITLRLKRDQSPEILYPELRARLKESGAYDALEPREKSRALRETVLDLRRGKSMLLDPSDPNARSCGSFFLNPVLDNVEEWKFRERLERMGVENFPQFPDEKGLKIPAAWLVEKAGFPRGYESGGAAISEKHALALVNRGATSGSLLRLAGEIQKAVREKFGVVLALEPVVVHP